MEENNIYKHKLQNLTSRYPTIADFYNALRISQIPGIRGLVYDFMIDCAKESAEYTLSQTDAGDYSMLVPLYGDAIVHSPDFKKVIIGGETVKQEALYPMDGYHQVYIYSDKPKITVDFLFFERENIMVIREYLFSKLNSLS